MAIVRAPSTASAESLAERQRTISVSEFFLKNRHLLGFDSPARALLTAVKEAVDNALDACEEARTLPVVSVQVQEVSDHVYRVVVEDNGPGIVEKQIGKIFGKLLYGSRFHRLSQSRGQQGLGISAAGMYGQLTTGKPTRIVSRTGTGQPAWEFVLSLDTSKNRPDLHKKLQIDWERQQGTRVEMEMEGQYRTGAHSIELYLEQVAAVNPHVTLDFVDPHGKAVHYAPSIQRLPPEPREIKLHPHGIEVGQLMSMLRDTRHKHLLPFLVNEFSRVGRKTAISIIERADRGLSPRSYPRRVAHLQAKALHRAMSATKISAPSTDCVVPIGEKALLAGLKERVSADFYCAVTRPPGVYRGNPFVVEVGLAYGQGKSANARAVTLEATEPIKLWRFANRVPLLFQQSACAITQAVIQTHFKNYGMAQTQGALPIGPALLAVHFASVWVPFTSESKEAIADYSEISKELKLALQHCGRLLRAHIGKSKRLQQAAQQHAFIEQYVPHVGEALEELLELNEAERDESTQKLARTLHDRWSG